MMRLLVKSDCFGSLVMSVDVLASLGRPSIHNRALISVYKTSNMVILTFLDLNFFHLKVGQPVLILS